MRIAVLGWRYVGNPAAGGAETLVHENMRRLVAAGHEVTCFTAAYPGAEPEAEADGVRIVRRGRQWTVHLHAWRWLRPRLDQFDRVIDHINTIPFFTPLYVPRAKRRFLHHQLARRYWFRQTSGLFRLIAPIGYALEPLMVASYRWTEGLTISESSRRDLARFGIPADQIAILPMGLPFAVPDELAPKPDGLRVVVLGRLEPAKHVEEAIEAFARVARERPEATLDVIGGGSDRYRAELERLVERRGLARAVTFHGRVEREEDKLDLLRRAHVHVFASHREGWGLTVSEAAAMGTPSVGYDVSGVRDSIADPRLLAWPGDAEAMGRLALELVADRERYDEIRRAAWLRARELDYDRSAAFFAEAIGLTA